MSMNKFKDPAIIILTLTVVSYGITYIYETGYKSYYKLPAMFIDLSINSMTSTLTATFFVFISIYASWNFLKFMHSEVSKEVPSYILLTNSTFIKGVRTGITDNIKLLNLIVICFCLPFIANSTGRLGEYAASEETEYMVIKQSGLLYVAVTSYKDSLIIAPLNLEKESMTPKFKAIEMKELKDTETIHFENGLKVEDVRNSKDLIE
ncbi:hypothetical protein SAMN05878482_103489 [Peribacillus simplex]|uniref:Uncharacterized protein n=1 Tax=Peribacillus simplex TaxID=1478 RepID=A0A9X8R9M0_9BACI|nr:hypothetical protein [Peribacillus simplex]SIR38274.1 hypothetical protein SAMN05878482_103489 [Peribacillus simplex]